MTEKQLQEFVREHFGLSAVPQHWWEAFRQLINASYKEGFMDGVEEAKSV